MVLLIILCWIAIALIYALQYQIVRDYKPTHYYLLGNRAYESLRIANFLSLMSDKPYTKVLACKLERESIFKFPFFKFLKS